VLNFKSPLEVLKGRKVAINHLRTFGCTCFVHIQSKDRDKFDSRAVKCVFLGYSSTQKGYKCYNIKARKLIVSRDVRFDESTSFFQLADHEPQGEHIDDLFPAAIPMNFINDTAAPQQ
jgi:hypothetical protein